MVTNKKNEMEDGLKLIDTLTKAAHVGDKRPLDIFATCDLSILQHALSHCTVDQLMYVENCSKSKGKDLSLITDNLWKNFYQREFGVQKTNALVERMRLKKVSFKWMELYQAKLKQMGEVENKAIDRIKRLYKKENERKQSRQVKVLETIPQTTKKRGFDEVSNLKKGNLMKKARKEFLNCREVKDLAALNRINALQRKN